MYKVICIKESCSNKNIIYYMPEATNPSMCGGCKNNIVPIKMNQEEYDSVFDYDPFASNPIVGN